MRLTTNLANFLARARKSLLALPLLCASLTSHSMPITTDLALTLVIDVSGSVNTTEYNLQMDGYANAFRDGAIQSNILGGTEGSIFVNVVFFASNFYTTVLDTFAHLNSVSAIESFADSLDTFIRPGSGGTNIYTGMDRATSLMGAALGSIFTTNNLVMDVSGDGDDTAFLVQASRDSAASAGITVNGLAIENSSSSTVITDFYTANVKTSDGFVVTAGGFADFDNAVREKLRIETGPSDPPPVPTPLPSTLLLVALGMLSLLYRKKSL